MGIHHHRKRNRLGHYNYSNPGWYFVTVCTNKMISQFGEIKNEKMVLNEFGNIVDEWWNWLSKQYPYCELDEYVIMPNHFHGIIIINPSLVGSLVVPVAGVAHFSHEVLWFFFSLGLMFWIILLVIFFNRIIFHNPLPNKLLPTLFILIAPPAIGFVSYVKLTGEVNEFAKILYYFALFLRVLLFSQYKMFKKIEFFLSWWAYSFPLSAISIASILMYHKTGIVEFKFIGLFLFALLFGLILYLLFKTFKSISNKEICVEEG